MSSRARLLLRIASVAALTVAVIAVVQLRRQNRQAEQALNVERAATAFERAHAARKLGDYNAAREGYLGALRLDRQHADARAALVELTLEVGATEEARHHLAELGKIVPAQDARLGRSRALLARP